MSLLYGKENNETRLSTNRSGGSILYGSRGEEYWRQQQRLMFESEIRQRNLDTTRQQQEEERRRQEEERRRRSSFLGRAQQFGGAVAKEVATPFAQAANIIAQGIGGDIALKKIAAARISGNKQAELNAIREYEKKSKILEESGGLLKAGMPGGITREELGQGAVAFEQPRKFARATLGTGAEIGSLVAGTPALGTAFRLGGAAGLARAGVATGIAGGLGTTGAAARQNPDLSVSDALKSFGTGATLGVGFAGGASLLGAGFKAARGGLVAGDTTEKALSKISATAKKATQEDELIRQGLANRPANLRAIEQGVTTDAERLALAGGDTGQAAIMQSPAERAALLQRIKERTGVTMGEGITPPTPPAITKQASQNEIALQNVNKKIEQARVQQNIKPADAQDLVREQQYLTQKIANPNEPVVAPISDKSIALASNLDELSTRTQRAITEPTITNTPNAVRQNQSILTDTLIKEFPELKPSIQRFDHTVRDQKVLAAAAKNMVMQDQAAAMDIFTSGTMAKINPDGYIKLGNELAQEAAKRGDTATLNQILGAQQAALTAHGQALRAAGNPNILTPDTLITYAAKKADISGRPLKPEFLKQLESTAKEVAKMPDGPKKIAAQATLKELAENPGILQKSGKVLKSITGSARAAMTSGDLSGGLLQGGVAFARYPNIGARAEAAGIRAGLSQAAFEREVAKLANLTDENGVALSQVFKRMNLSVNTLKGSTSEQFLNTALIEKVQGAKQIIQFSQRAYDITLDYMRANIAKKHIDSQGGVEAVMKNWNTAQFRSLGRVIDTITGVGRGGRGITGQQFQKMQPALSELFFSAQLWKSRLDLLNPLYYMEVANNPVAFRLAVRSGAQFAATVGTVLGLATTLGAKVETDLRSSDFGKIRIGNTRFNIMGGLQQNIVFAARMLMGEYKSSTTGIVTPLDTGKPGGMTRLGVAGRMVENKLAPVISEIISQIRGTNISGEKMTGRERFTSTLSNLVPLNIQDTYDAIAEYGPAGAANFIPSSIGIGASTYGVSGRDWARSDSKQLKQFKTKVTPEEFKQANDRYNSEYNQWLQSRTDDNEYQNLSLDEQQKARVRQQNLIKKNIFNSYGFKYQK